MVQVDWGYQHAGGRQHSERGDARSLEAATCFPWELPIETGEFEAETGTGKEARRQHPTGARRGGDS
jgi:hypothetical protein